MDKLYVSRDTDKYNASLCICHPEVLVRIENFLRTKFTNHDDDGNTYEFHSSYNGFVVWENLDGMYHTTKYAYSEFATDMELLGFEIISTPAVFDRFAQLIKYVEENNL